MTRLVNDPSTFATDALAGFADSQGDRVLPVGSGVVRAHRAPTGQVAIVMGGGSGHFPAFAGWVGKGFGHGAVCGGVFASPSDSQIVAVAREADSAGGVLFTPINYAGDMLHFTAAAERLRADGVDVRMVVITDDIASGSVLAPSDRRGIAGSFVVIKMAGAAAERGDSLAEVERIARAANDATRTFGVAFSGCTLPGGSAPLFTVPPGRMAVGLGIHGEPGISEQELGTAADVADVLVDGLFAERPPQSGRGVAVLVNGLGATKYDELFLVLGRVKSRLGAEGMHAVAPVAGEQVTSLDMAGVSVSFAYLDDELEELWLAAADTPSFSRGGVPTTAPPRRSLHTAAVGDEVIAEGSTASRAVGPFLASAFEAVQRLLEDQESRLGAVDAVAGDGDHGAGMMRGSRAAALSARESVGQGAGLGTILGRAGRAWSDAGGGASGAFWGAGLAAAGVVVGDQLTPGPVVVAAAAEAFSEAVRARGGAQPGDKTMVDAIVPFVEELHRGIDDGVSLERAWRAAADVALLAAEETAQITSRLGRSRLHGERSIGSPDAGALSFALVVGAV